ncbi:MAG: hypothetical protein CVU39_26510 [Chloroflexi bacterium HGW-Chloroflexi-10]|nr:MAG: hypothetical protein CVU39_26510 [Chloroflexi bacterium HGW-Chloroflexi-10]
MHEDWLTAEFYMVDEPLGELLEWGETLVLFPQSIGEPWSFQSHDKYGILGKFRILIKKNKR